MMNANVTKNLVPVPDANKNNKDKVWGERKENNLILWQMRG